MNPSSDHVVIVGAGIAGLTAAVQLSRQGLAVTVCEKEAGPGGKISQGITPLGPVDLGPTVCTMPWVFDSLLGDSAGSLESTLGAERLDVLAHHRWTDGSQLDLYSDPAKSLDAVASFAGVGEAQRFRRFQLLSCRLHDALAESFLHAAQPSLAGLLRNADPAGLVALLQACPFVSLWTRLAFVFRDPRLRQLFARYSTYCGSSPMAAPATLMLIAHAEQCGVWKIPGGMMTLASALEQRAISQGASFLYGREVRAIHAECGRVAGIEWPDGSRLRSAHVIANTDLSALRNGKLGPSVTSVVPGKNKAGRSLSAITWHGIARLGDHRLAHHNVCFSDDYPAEFRDLFDHRLLPSQPTVYVCASDRPESTGQQSTDSERIFLLINAPADGDKPGTDWDVMAQRAGESVTAQLDSCGLGSKLDIGNMQVTTPADFNRKFPATGGALYGGATHGWRSAFARPGAASRLPGLYLAGGGVHPGPGVPMAALSGLSAANCILAECELAARSRILGPARA